MIVPFNFDYFNPYKEKFRDDPTLIVPGVPPLFFDHADEYMDVFSECPYTSIEFTKRSFMLFVFTVIISNMFALVVYLCIEKPAMDARNVYKSVN